MGVYKQKKGDKGSLKWIQILINNRPDIIDLHIRHNLKIPECTGFSKMILHFREPQPLYRELHEY